MKLINAGLETFLRPVGVDRLLQVNAQDARLAKKTARKAETGCRGLEGNSPGYEVSDTSRYFRVEFSQIFTCFCLDFSHSSFF